MENKGLKEKWLNGMLRFSGIIANYKNKVIETNGPKIIVFGLFVLVLEIANLIFSLPAYAFIAPQSFPSTSSGQADGEAIKSYRLRRVVSLSVIGGFVLTVIIWMSFGILGLTLFPEKSKAATTAWDFNLPLAYHYDGSKIQIIDGAVIFKANLVVTPQPAPIIEQVIESVPVEEVQNTETLPVEEVIEVIQEETSVVGPMVEPAPDTGSTGSPQATPIVPTGPTLFNNLFQAKTAFAQTLPLSFACTATLEPIAPLIISPFYGWTSFSEIATKDGGQITYNLSQDGGLTWLFWNGASWTQSSGSEANPDWNTATEVNSHISDLSNPNSQGSATLSFKAKFVSDCNHDVTLHSLDMDYDDTETILSGIVEVDTGVATTTVTTTEENTAVLEVSDSTASTTLENSLTTSTEINTNIATPINFSIHVVIETTGQSGNVLYSIPGLFTLKETDNGLEVKVVSAPTLSVGAPTSLEANVGVGDHIIVLTYDGSILKFYIDGSLSSSVSVPIVIAPPLNVSTEIGCTSAGVILETLSLAQINANYIECGNSAPIVYIQSASQQLDDGFVDINYKITDLDNNFASLSQIQFSTTGVFAGEERTMTLATFDLDNDGSSGLTSGENGTNHTLVWDAALDLSDTRDSSVFIRLKASDGLALSPSVIFGPIAVNTITPLQPTNLLGVSSNEDQILWHWEHIANEVAEDNFGYYQIVYGTSPDLLDNIWGPSQDSDLNFSATDRTIITGLLLDTIYYAKVRSADTLGYVEESATALFRTQIVVEVSSGSSSVSTSTVDVNINTETNSSETGTEISGGLEIGTGEILPDDSTALPIAPQGGFRVKINQENTKTDSANTTLYLYTGSNVSLMMISNNSDFSDAVLEDFSSTKSWDICLGLNSCESGEHRVYIKYYTAFGIGSVAVSDVITLNLPITLGTSMPDSAESPSPLLQQEGGSESNTESQSSNIETETSSSGSSDTGRRNSNSQNSNVSNNQNQQVSSGGNIVSTVAPFTQALLNDLSSTKESGVVKKPEISNVSKSITENNITFEGSGIPKSKIALFIHSDQVVVYTTEVDESGKWSFSHDQKNIELAPGEHQVFAVTYDPGSKVKSKPSLIETFEVKRNMATVFLSYFNLPTTILTLLIILLIVSYLFSRKEKVKSSDNI